MKLRLNVRALKAGIGLLAVILMLAAALILLDRWEHRPIEADPTPSSGALYEDDPGVDLVYFNGGWYRPRTELETVLLLGLDKYEQTAQIGYTNDLQSDFLLLLAVDRQNQRCTAIHLNRDTMTRIGMLGPNGESTGSFVGQLALAHTYGTGGDDSCQNAVEAVSGLLYGVEIDHYVSMTMEGVCLLNDLAGGVTLEVMDDLSQLDPALVPGETVTLTGQQALTYVRARQGLEDSSNLRRMERQRQYMRALNEQLLHKTEQDGEFALNSLPVLSEHMVSDCTVEQLSTYADLLEAYGMSEFVELPGRAVQGQVHMEYHVDEAALQTMVVELFYELTEAD